MKTFESLIEDLEKEEGTRIVFDKKKFEKALGNPLPGILNFHVMMYLCFNSPVNGVIPSIGKIARDLKMDIKMVKYEIEKLKYYGVLEG